MKSAKSMKPSNSIRIRETKNCRSDMKKNAFELFMQSVREMKAIDSGDLVPARSITLQVADVKSIRGKTKMSQTEFATMIGVSIVTLQDWESGKRKPVGSAKALLRVVDARPDAVIEVLRPMKTAI